MTLKEQMNQNRTIMLSNIMEGAVGSIKDKFLSLQEERKDEIRRNVFSMKLLWTENGELRLISPAAMKKEKMEEILTPKVSEEKFRQKFIAKLKEKLETEGIEVSTWEDYAKESYEMGRMDIESKEHACNGKLEEVVAVLRVQLDEGF